ncbi:MAG: glycosyltransferase family 87 protein, partial [Thermodesulfobacteriota bacterium]
MLTYRKKTFLSISVISLFTLFCLVFFFIHLLNIKKDTPTTAFGADLIAYYTAAQLMNAGEISEIYVEIKDDFSVVNSGKFYETAKNSGFHLTPTRYVYLPIFLAPFQLLTRFSFSTSALLCLSVNLFIIIAVILLEWSFTKDLPYPILRLMLVTSLNLSLFPLFYALKLGQSSIIIYLVICLIYLFSMKKKDYLAGILLGIIITLKFSPLLFTL